MKQLNQFITEYIIKKKLDKPIDSEDNYKYYPKTKDELIHNIKNLIKQDIYDFNCIDISKITDMSNLFRTINVSTNIDVSNWNVSNVETMEGMFAYCNKFDCDLSNWDVSNVTDMKGMFTWCDNFTGKGLEKWDVSNVTNMKYMFGNCIKFEGKSIENWDVSNVISTRNMFYRCENLDCDLSNWDVSKVMDMNQMFYNCINFEGDGIEKWNVNNVKYMNNMFGNCTSLKNKPSWYKE